MRVARKLISFSSNTRLLHWRKSANFTDHKVSHYNHNKFLKLHSLKKVFKGDTAYNTQLKQQK